MFSIPIAKDENVNRQDTNRIGEQTITRGWDENVANVENDP